MENWIGIGIWIVLGLLIAMVTRMLIGRPEETRGHTVILGTLAAFAAVIGGMLGVGIGSFREPTALSLAGMVGAVFFSFLMSVVYRWGVRGLI